MQNNNENMYKAATIEIVQFTYIYVYCHLYICEYLYYFYMIMYKVLNNSFHIFSFAQSMKLFIATSIPNTCQEVIELISQIRTHEFENMMCAEHRSI